MEESESWLSKRKTWNISMFIISYVISNLVSGIIYDTYINYLQEVSITVATSFWAFYGYATFISAFILVFIPKIGYKKLLMFSSVSCSAALLSVLYLDSPTIFNITTLLALTGIQLHYAMLAPFIAVYTKSKNKISWYTKTYYMGYIGYFLTTFLGGALTVKMFSLRAGQTYSSAKALTEYVSEMSPVMKVAYLQGNKDVLFMAAVLSLSAIVPAILIREKKDDYFFMSTEERKPFIQQVKDILKSIMGRDSIIYMIYWAMISFGMGLFSSYYTVFLNRNLHIDKVTSSQLVSLSYLAIVVFMLFTPWVVKKFGQIVTLGGVALLSIPFMLLIANGDAFGKYTIPVVGISLFIRSGLINLSSPVDSSLSMEIVPDRYRPAYASALNFVAGLASIASGMFTGKVLFVTQEGYRTAYYIAAIIYDVACTILLIGLWKYNKAAKQEGESSHGEN
ncbi:MFS transporter [Clostridium culturomicium]|uniref:MFS transporter n=1 Tax=Clostridium culturomicium TaxID=1499683 RepID=UPI0038571EB1